MMGERNTHYFTILAFEMKKIKYWLHSDKLTMYNKLILRKYIFPFGIILVLSMGFYQNQYAQEDLTEEPISDIDFLLSIDFEIATNAWVIFNDNYFEVDNNMYINYDVQKVENEIDDSDIIRLGRIYASVLTEIVDDYFTKMIKSDDEQIIKNDFKPVNELNPYGFVDYSIENRVNMDILFEYVGEKMEVQEDGLSLSVHRACTIWESSWCFDGGGIGHPHPASTRTTWSGSYSTESAAVTAITNAGYHQTAGYACGGNSGGCPRDYTKFATPYYNTLNGPQRHQANIAGNGPYTVSSTTKEPNPEIHTYLWPPFWPGYVIWWHDNY